MPPRHNKHGLEFQKELEKMPAGHNSWFLTAIVLFLTSLSPHSKAEDKATGAGGAKKKEESQLYMVRYIEVEPKNREAFVKAVEEKTKKFDVGENVSQWWTYRILTGPRTNMFARGFGPTTPSQLDNPKFPVQGLSLDLNDKEALFWKENIQPLEKSTGNTELWLAISGLSYTGLPAGTTAKFVRHRKWKMKPGMYQRLEAHYKDITKAIASQKRPVNWQVSRLEAGGDFMTYAETMAFNNLADVAVVGDFKNAFNKVNGENSWEKFLKEHNAVMQENASVETEIWAFQQNMSSPPLPVK